MITSCKSPLEIINQHRIAEHIFNRFEIDNNATNGIVENTSLTEINPDFLVDVLNVFCNYQDADFTLFSKYHVPTIIDYLKRSHQYYLNKILPEIGQSISILLKNYPKSHPLLEILYKFYFKYKVDLQVHFNEEEDTIFLYGKGLYEAVYFRREVPFFTNFLKQNSINDFIENHGDTVEDLKEIMAILSIYNPSSTNKTAFRILIEQLKNFKHDLEIHAFIEDKVLIKKLSKLEEQIKAQYFN